MKTKSVLVLFIRYLFPLFLFVGWVSSATVGHVYVKPKELAKQYLTELALKEALIKAFKPKASCLVNLEQSGFSNGANQSVNSITHGTNTISRSRCTESACLIESDCLNRYHDCNNPFCETSGGSRLTGCTNRDDCTSAHTCNSQSAGRWKAGTESTWTANLFNDKNVEIVKMQVTDDGGEDRTFTAYYKRKGLEVYNTIDNQTCSYIDQEGCFKAECTIEFDSSGAKKCKLETCCAHCWSISGGL